MMFYILMFKFVPSLSYILPDNVTEINYFNEVANSTINYEEANVTILQFTSTSLIHEDTKMNISEDNLTIPKFYSIPSITNKIQDTNLNISETVDLFSIENDENININNRITEKNDEKQAIFDDKCENVCMSKSCINTAHEILNNIDPSVDPCKY